MKIRYIFLALSVYGIPVLGSAAASASGKDVKEKVAQDNSAIVKVGEWPTSVAFSPNGNLVAVTNGHDDTVSVFKVDGSTGRFTAVQGSPFLTGKRPYSVAFSPDSNFAAIADYDDGTVSMFAIDNGTGRFDQVQGSPFKGALRSKQVEFFRDGKFVAVLDDESSTVNVFSVDTDKGFINEVQGSPFGTDQWPYSLALSPNGSFAAVSSRENKSLNVFSIDSNSGKFTQVEGSTFKTGDFYPSLAFSLDGIFAAASNSDGNVISLFKVDSRTGKFTQVEGSPFKTGKFPLSIAFSPNGNFVVIANHSSNNISVFSIDRSKGGLTPIAGSPFDTGKNPSALAFSPNGILAVVCPTESSVRLYELNDETGVLTPLTGQMLNKVHRQKEYEQARKAFDESKALVGDPVMAALRGYLMGEEETPVQQKQKVAQEKEFQEQESIQRALAQTATDQADSDNQSVRLFAAIKASDLKAVQENLTPFTINKRDADFKTPLIAAAQGGNLEIVNALLNYQGIIKHTAIHQETMKANKGATDLNGNTALIYAVLNSNWQMAAALAKEMKLEEVKIRNKAGKRALDLMAQYMDRYEKDADYQEAVEIINSKSGN